VAGGGRRWQAACLVLGAPTPRVGGRLLGASPPPVGGRVLALHPSTKGRWQAVAGCLLSAWRHATAGRCQGPRLVRVLAARLVLGASPPPVPHRLSVAGSLVSALRPSTKGRWQAVAGCLLGAWRPATTGRWQGVGALPPRVGRVQLNGRRPPTEGRW
jgi:hypothetical protein